jgi:hypothetical protein
MPLPVARIVPSGVKATGFTLRECPVRVEIACPVPIFHKRIVLSSLPLARILPSGLIATELIAEAIAEKL